MSKRRKSKQRNTSFTYEVYGIIILILSIIALASGRGEVPGMGPFGRALNYICLFIAGELSLVLPLIAIYVGLYVMIKRKWPKSWSYKKTGLLLILIAVLSLSSMRTYLAMYPEDTLAASTIFADPFANLKAYLMDEGMSYNDFLAGVGGGVVGAIGFGVLYAFFDFMGARLILFAVIAIGVLYLTGWSYVEFGSRIKKLLHLIGRKIKKEWIGITQQLKKRKQHQSVLTASSDVEDEEGSDQEDVLLNTEEIDEESYNPHIKRKRKNKTSFFDLIRPAARGEKEDEQEDEHKNEAEEVTVYAASEDVQQTADIEEAHNTPLVIRDFLEHDEQAETASHDTAGTGEPETLQPEVVDEPSAEEDDLAFTGMGQTAHNEEKPRPPYKLPPFHLLSKPIGAKGGGSVDYEANARKLEKTLESFGVRTKVLEVVRGPAVTRYEIMPDVGVKVSRIVSLTDDIALALAAKDIRMEAPIPGKSAIGIEVPNTEVSIVTMREVMENAAFLDSSSKLSVVLGRDISGQPMVANLAKMPHLLVAGATGSGKSVCINAIITSILYKAKPDEVKFLMVDPKMVELNVYNGIPHLLAPVVTDPRRASLALKKIVAEMEKRYELFSKTHTRNIEAYNAQAIEHEQEPLPFIVVIVDELADLMMVAAGDVEDAITRLAQMARAAGIHLIIATQRPSVDVITGVIKANIPSRIAFGVSSQVDSRTILDAVGAEKLLGRGDMLYLPVGESKPIRIQGAFLSDREVEAVVNYVSSQEKAEYREELVPEIEEQAELADEFVDELFDQAAHIVLEAKQASVSLLQRRLRIGYTRAARLIDSMEAAGIIGPYEGSKPREVLMTLEQFQHTRTGT